MKHSRFDWILVACFAILASWSGYQLYGPSATISSDGPSYAKLQSLSNVVKSKSRGALGWNDVELGQQFKLRDQLYTHQDSTAILNLTSGQNLTLWPNTLVELDQLAGSPSLQVKEGMVYLDLRAGEKIKINLAGKELTLSGQGSRVKLSSFSGKAKLESAQGEVNVTSELGKIETLNQKKSLEIDSDSKLKTIQIQAQLTSPADGEIIETDQALAKVRFDWVLSENIEESIVIELSSDPSFAFKKTFQQKNAELVPGFYFWRIKSKNKVIETKLMGFEIVRARAREIEGEKLVKIIEPIDMSSMTVSRPGELIEFKFEGSGVLQIAKDDQFRNIVLNQRADQIYSWPVTELGRFFWRVRTDAGESSIQSFELQPGEVLPAPAFERAPSEIKLEVLDSSSMWLPSIFLQPAYAQEFVADFSWPKVEGANAYLVEIFSSTSSKKPILSKKVQTENFKWIGAPLRVVYWRVRAIDAWERLGRAGELVKTALLPPTGWENTDVDLYAPKHKTQTEVNERVRFEWAKSQGVKKWTWLLSRDLSFNKPERTYQTKNNYLVVENLPVGNWYWKVLAKDQLGRTLESKRRFIEVIRPDEEIILAREKKKIEYNYRLNLRSPFDIELALKVTKPNYEYSKGAQKFVLGGFSASGVDLNLSRSINDWRGVMDLSYVSGTAFSSLAYKDALLKLEAQKAFNFGLSFPVWLGGGIAYAQTSGYTRAATSNDLSEETLSSISASLHASFDPWTFSNSYVQTTFAISAPSRLGLKASARHIFGNWFWGGSIEKQSLEDEGKLSVTSLALNFGYRWQRKNN